MSTERRPGPSPRVRGKRGRHFEILDRIGSIPASAGETRSAPASGSFRGVHPRECGGNIWIFLSVSRTCGPSPRVRGKHSHAIAAAASQGSIPASAGETEAGERDLQLAWVHPRECGGNPNLRAGAGQGGRSIPASAGETRASWPWRLPATVHPRECGGNGTPAAAGPLDGGPSPRVRGKQMQSAAGVLDYGSIPASAGETNPSSRIPRELTVHPRECGGNPRLESRSSVVSGPSPRVRGKRNQDMVDAADLRSIPASAGETPTNGSCRSLRSVHPRECGGNCRCTSRSLLPPGPSPRVRGKPHRGAPMRLGRGSIPASAGETLAATSWA